jgi:hypothetical protein
MSTVPNDAKTESVVLDEYQTLQRQENKRVPIAPAATELSFVLRTAEAATAKRPWSQVEYSHSLSVQPSLSQQMKKIEFNCLSLAPSSQRFWLDMICRRPLTNQDTDII